jgi:hypothetical protein
LVGKDKGSTEWRAITPFECAATELVRLKDWRSIVGQNVRGAWQHEASQGQGNLSRIPQSIRQLLKQLGNQNLHFPAPNVDQVFTALDAFQIRERGCLLMLYPNLLLIWQTESNSDILEIMDPLSCFLHDVFSTSRIQDAM